MKRVNTLVRNITGFGEGDKRSNLAKKNIFGSIIIKGLNIGVGLLLIPLTINYLEPTRYGIWITLSSIIGWFGFFDIGLGNGLRNRLAEALAKEDLKLARIYVSTTYAILSLIILGVLLLFYLVNPLLNWNKILNAGVDIISQNELSLLASIVFTFFSVQFVLKLIATILRADQLPAKASLFDFFAKLISLIFILILIKTTEGSLLYLGVIISLSPLLVLAFASLWFFNKKYKNIRPGWSFVKFDKAKDLFSLGAKFFLIQIAAILLYQTNTIIISQLFGPEQVAPYNIAFQYFSIIMMVFSIIVSPFWSAFTEAWIKNDVNWIKNIMNKLFKVWGVLFFISIIMVLVSKPIFNIWIGDVVSIPIMMSILVCIWILINTWNSIFSQFLNGVGKLKLQLYLGLGGALLNVPLAIYMGIKIGILGVLLANIVVSIVGVILYPIQYKRIINNNAKGIWND